MECNKYSPSDGNPRLGDACTGQGGSEKHAAILVSFAPIVKEPHVQASPVVVDIEFGKASGPQA